MTKYKIEVDYYTAGMFFVKINKLSLGATARLHLLKALHLPVVNLTVSGVMALYTGKLNRNAPERMEFDPVVFSFDDDRLQFKVGKDHPTKEEYERLQCVFDNGVVAEAISLGLTQVLESADRE